MHIKWNYNAMEGFMGGKEIWRQNVDYCILHAPLYSLFSLYTNKEKCRVYFQNYKHTGFGTLHMVMLRKKPEVSNYTVLIIKLMS